MDFSSLFPAVRFENPILLAFFAVLVPAVAWRLRTLPREHTGARRRAIQGAMLISVMACALALAGFELGTASDRLAVLFVVDRSRSVGEAEGTRGAFDRIARATESMGVEDLAGLVVFGSDAATEVSPAYRPSFGAATAPIARDGTNIDAALRQALADLPADHAGRLVLLTDGVETDGDALEAASIAASRGVPIDVLPIVRAPSPEIAVERVQVPAHARKDQPVEIRVVTRATRAANARAQIFRDGVPIATAEVPLREGTDALTLRDVIPTPGVHRYDVRIEAREEGADHGRENNEGGAIVRVSGGARALILSEHPEASEALSHAVRAAGFEVDLRGREGIPPDLETLAAYDLLVLSDLHARAFLPEGLADVQRYVRDLGGGLWMLGARDAFGTGGYAHTPIEDALPATFDLRNRRDRASLGMVIAIDKSGSMSEEVAPGVNKLSLANEAAARSALLLSPTDRAGVMHVDTEVGWTLPMRSVDDPEAIAAAIRRARVGGGGIYVDVALEASYRALRAEKTMLRHLLLFSDGSDSEEMNRAPALVAQALRDKITTSVVSMGRGPDTAALERLSRLGDGRFYIVNDMRELPRIFTEETIEASKSAFVETPFQPHIATPYPAIRGIDFDSAPALLGHVVMNQKPGAARLLHATQTEPLLLVWQHGLGRAATFAADAGGGPFSNPWLGWSGYAALAGQLVSHLARTPEREDVRAQVSIESGKGRIRVDVIDREGRYQNHLALRAAIAGPGAEGTSIPLVQTSGGRYEATFDASAPGAYLVAVADAQGAAVATAGVVRAGGEELRGEGTDQAKIAQIAALSGGRVLSRLDRLFRDRPPPTYAYRPLWRALLITSLCALLLSVALRRLVFPPLRFFARAKTRLSSTTHPDFSPSPAATLESLRASRALRAEEPSPPPPFPDPVAAGDGGASSDPIASTADAPAPSASSPSKPEAQLLAEKLLHKKRRRDR